MTRFRRLGLRGGLVVCVLLLTAATTVAAVRLVSEQMRAASVRNAPRAGGSPHARFLYLSGQHTNRCGMPASALKTMSPGSRLQGSCCFPMNYASYVKQLRELKDYADVAVIPADPYDIRVELANRLIGYQTIKLTPAQRRTYERAKPLSTTKGPCCCPCWRWTAFGGQAKYLITRRHYTARQIADVWSFEEGCGGSSDA